LKTPKINKKTTIYDIAAEVGTSTATVSRVLSNSGYPVREELRNHIMKAANQLNYTPNMVGRMLKKNESHDIGVIIPTISNPFYTQLVLGIELEARKRGYNILLCNSFREAAAEKKYLESLYQKRVSGIILSSVDENHEYLRHMKEKGVHIVLVDQIIDDLQCSRIGFDYIKGGMIAVEYLIKAGHRNIAFLSSPLTRRSRKETLEGYRLALIKNEIEFRKENLIVSESEEESRNGTYEYENGKMLAQKVLELEDRPTAIFAVNDMTAFGVINKLLSCGIRVPEDISVIGFDNIDMSSMIHPPLTTVNQPAYETGRQASRLLLDGIESGGSEDMSMTLEPTLIIRSSVGKPTS
jgi:LacI family transcriptional regulator